jgi:RNA polymerase sigma factor (sigma-70 family)
VASPLLLGGIYFTRGLEIVLDSGFINRRLWDVQIAYRSRKILDDQPPPRQKWTLTPEAFNALLSWLDPDREQAGQRYEEIRSGLIKGFIRHGCTVPEDLADETINRVAKRIPEIAATYRGDPARYFYGVAHNVHMEYLRRPQVVPLPQTELRLSIAPTPPESTEDIEPVYSCLSGCMEQLTPRNREMILQYYRGERRVKIMLRRELAERLGVQLSLLRLQAQRVRAGLKKCILDCLSRKAPT